MTYCNSTFNLIKILYAQIYNALTLFSLQVVMTKQLKPVLPPTKLIFPSSIKIEQPLTNNLRNGML